MKKEQVTIFYETAEGTMTQWSGTITKVDPTLIVIRRHKQEMNFDLTKSNFLLVTLNHVKDLGLGDKERKDSKFNTDLRENLIDTFKDNTYLLWDGRKLVTKEEPVAPRTS
jgi:hypothetical protein